MKGEDSVLVRGFAANRDAVLDSGLEDFRYIHFATHGLVDARYPGLSALVLSQFDERGRPRDGFLRLNDIYNLKLGADLVVLSACDTAAGDDRAALGLAGIAIKAGARSAVATLWQVHDEVAAELVATFYTELQDPTVSRAAALRRAQMKVLTNPRYEHPGFWSPFLMINNWL